MNIPLISSIAAIQWKDRGIGKGPQLLFRISDDIKRFKELTTGHPVIMGRKTFDSFPAKFKPLPDRTNIVITRSPEWSYEGVEVAHSLEEALRKAQSLERKEIFIIGGGEIYKEAMPLIDRLYLTIVDGNLEADVFFPDYSELTHETSTVVMVDEKSGLQYQFKTLER